MTPPASSPANLSYESFNSLIDESSEKVEDSNSERAEGGGENNETGNTNLLFVSWMPCSVHTSAVTVDVG